MEFMKRLRRKSNKFKFVPELNEVIGVFPFKNNENYSLIIDSIIDTDIPHKVQIMNKLYLEDTVFYPFQEGFAVFRFDPDTDLEKLNKLDEMLLRKLTIDENKAKMIKRGEKL